MSFKDRSWTEVRVVVPPDAVDAISAFLFDHGSLGTTEEEGKDPTRGSYVLLRAYFDAEPFAAERAAFEKGLGDALARAGAPKTRIWVDEIPYGDWAEGWKRYFKPRRVGKRIVIAPTWEEPEAKPGDVVIRVDPGMAFGTGQHETTSLCLAALEELAPRFAGGRALDVGTGTGILAIAAVKLGAKSALGVDVDPEAVTAAKENVAANGMDASVVEIAATPIAEVPGTYAVVVANILAEVLIELATPIAAKVADGGVLVLSGILAHLAPKVWEAYRAAGMIEIETRRDGEWACLVASRATGSS